MYQGIVRAIKDYQDPLKEHEVTVFVRRGGPNYQEGLRVMGEVGEFVHVCVVYKKINSSVLDLMLMSFVCVSVYVCVRRKDHWYPHSCFWH